jgi:hypothetical protein
MGAFQECALVAPLCRPDSEQFNDHRLSLQDFICVLARVEKDRGVRAPYARLPGALLMA